ncbi:MAG: UvrD-helicase domain-containing protein [Rubrivivax sp.]
MSDASAAARAAYRVDGALVDSAAFYAVACDPRRSVVVEACAGAGKTWMLVSRMLRALLDGVAPEQILAITFTRRAAGEMQERLQTWLEEFGDDRSDADTRIAELRLRGLDAARAEALQQPLGELRRRLQRLPRAVEVRTFHAWFAQLAMQMPMQLRAQLALPAQFALIEDPQPLQPELMRRWRWRVQADEALRRDHDALVLAQGRSRVQAWLHTAWRRSDELALADAAGVLEPSVPPASALDPEAGDAAALQARLARPELVERWQALALELGRSAAKRTRDLAAGLVAALEAVAAGDTPRAYGLARAAVYTREGTPRAALGSGAAQAALLADLDRLATLLAQQTAHEDHLRLVRLWRVLQREYQRLKVERGLADMADLERAAHLLLGDAAAAGWVAQRLDQRFQQVLIDEFQDTSPLQWHTLFGWLSSYAGAGGGASGQRPPSLFIVGDPKQSIYRFRRAEPRVFEAATTFVVDGLQGHHLSCDHTRRNAPELVDAVNAVFGDAAQADGWTPFRAHTTGVGPGGALQALPGLERPADDGAAAEAGRWRDSLTEPRVQIDEPAKLAEARQLAHSVAALLRDEGIEPARVMVLARRRAMLRLLADALAEAGVPCVMPEPLALDESPEAQDLVALLDVLASPGHDLSLARALRSPLFGCGDADLQALARAARERGGCWIDTLVQPPLASPGLAQAAARVAQWREAFARLTPHELLDRVVHEGDALARLLAAVPPARRAQARHAVQALLQAALDLGGGRFVSTYAFVRALRQGRLEAPAQAASGAVRLLTVHGAKGLEADVVYLADTDPEAGQTAQATLLVDWPVHEAAPRCAAFVARESAVPPALQPLLLREQREREREELNALYVAMTRARRRLVVSHSEPFRGSTARSWWQRLAPWVQPLPAAAPAGAAALTADALVERLPPAPPAVVPDEADGALDRQGAALGRAVHRLLEWIGQPQQPLPRDRRAAAARQAAAEAGLAPAAAAEVEALASTIADSPDCAPFFGGAALRWAGAEVPLGDAGRVLRLDRLVLLDDEAEGRRWWVLDYKLHARPGQLQAYRDQLARYRDVLRATLAAGGDVAPVHAAFLTGGGVRVTL